MTVFIGGSKEICHLSYRQIDELKKIILKNHKILIGDCYGVDTAVQQLLSDWQYQNVTVYVSGEKVRNNIGNFEVKHITSKFPENTFDFNRQKDVAMAKSADYGFMIWNGKSKGTRSNILDLLSQGKPVTVMIKDKIIFLRSLSDINKFGI